MPNTIYRNKRRLVFEQNAILKHGNKFKIDLSTFVDTRSKMRFVCNDHGEFWQTPTNHLNSFGCRECGYDLKLTPLKKTPRPICER